MLRRKYHYVGPAEIRDVALAQARGTAIRTVVELTRWLHSAATDNTGDGYWVATFTVGVDGVLLLAPRRSEHVACASGEAVLSAGEMTLNDEGKVVEVSNLSTGYCPEADSWPAVETALNRIGIEHPGRFTQVVVFRLCPRCRQRNIVKDSWYYCQICDAKLPESWNLVDT